MPRSWSAARPKRSTPILTGNGFSAARAAARKRGMVAFLGSAFLCGQRIAPGSPSLGEGARGALGGVDEVPPGARAVRVEPRDAAAVVPDAARRGVDRDALVGLGDDRVLEAHDARDDPDGALVRDPDGVREVEVLARRVVAVGELRRVLLEARDLAVLVLDVDL